MTHLSPQQCKTYASNRFNLYLCLTRKGLRYQQGRKEGRMRKKLYGFTRKFRVNPISAGVMPKTGKTGNFRIFKLFDPIGVATL